MKLSIHSNIRDYEAIFENTNDFINYLAEHRQACFVIDENVWRLYSSSLFEKLSSKEVITIPIHENRKNLDTVKELYDRLVEFPAKRNLLMVSIGGGILQDVSGFAASTIYRGIDWIYIPTTLLAQADSCIGSKTSLNYSNYKNLIGTFYPPSRIHIYTTFLKSLDDADFYSGFGEVIKLHLMGGRDYFTSLLNLSSLIHNRDNTALTTAIQQSLKVKLSFMEGDEFDMGRRNLLNYGHDFGHAVESTSDFEIPHGQAVILGMIAANIVSRQRGKLSAEIEKDLAENLLYPNLFMKPSADSLRSDGIINAMKKDKKRTGDQLALIMMDDNFLFSRVNDLATNEVLIALAELRVRLGY